MGTQPVRIQFPLASQPEIMRAAEKDEYYVGQLCEACYDAFRSTFGTRLAVAYQNELKLAGRALYYLLTTGAGLQTLGEEYCDILQVSGPSGLSATPARRTMLVFYQTILPYLAERLSARAAARGNALAAENESNEESTLQNEVVVISEDPQSSRQSEIEPQRNVDGASTSRGLSYRERLQQAGSRLLQRWPVVLPSVREAMVLIMRTHLMVYYFEGLYYHIGKRVTGIRYIYMGKPSQQRPRYHILGLFLSVQLAFVCGHWLSRMVIPAMMSSMRSQRVQQPLNFTGTAGIPILDEDGNVVQEKPGVGWQPSFVSDSEVSVPSKCPLCLGPRQYPTATPCGHVFCWNCIAEWCNEKPECPLCRAPVLHPDLVCVYHADF